MVTKVSKEHFLVYLEVNYFSSIEVQNYFVFHNLFNVNKVSIKHPHDFVEVLVLVIVFKKD